MIFMCPNCNAPLHEVNDFGSGKRPKRGDLSVCLHCCAMMIFTNSDLDTRLFTMTEFRALPLDEMRDLFRVICAVKELHEFNPILRNRTFNG